MNPGCPLDICNEDDDTKTLIHVKADGDNDTLHYIWDFNRQPTVLVALTERNSNLTIKWNQISKDAGTVTFSSKPKYTMSFVLTKVSKFLHLFVVKCHKKPTYMTFPNVFHVLHP